MHPTDGTGDPWAEYMAMSELELWEAVAEHTSTAEKLRDELATRRRFLAARQRGEFHDEVPPEELASASVNHELRADMALTVALTRRYNATVQPLVELGVGENGCLVEVEIPLCREEPELPWRPAIIATTRASS